MTYPPGTPLPPAKPARPAAWLPDPLDNALVRYWDGHRWTFHTAVRRTVVPVEASRAIRRRRRSPPCGPTWPRRWNECAAHSWGR